jgi:tRNA pseudouridine38-40 synthase
MQRYFVQLSFKGTHYHGWQIQPNAKSVQETLEKAFSVLLGEKIKAVGAGRTDTGVHASYFVFHFDSYNSDIDINTNKLVYRLNSLLPSDISINRIDKVEPDAHARFSAISRTYRYFVTQVKDPFITDTSYYCNVYVNLDKMNEAASILKKYNDFSSFSRLHSNVKTNICKISFAEWERKENMVVFTIRADRFLRNMVRAITGTLLLIGRGKTDIDDFISVIESKNRCAAGPSAPAHGLFLTNIEYPDTINKYII